MKTIQQPGFPTSASVSKCWFPCTYFPLNLTLPINCSGNGCLCCIALLESTGCSCFQRDSCYFSDDGCKMKGLSWLHLCSAVYYKQHQPQVSEGIIKRQSITWKNRWMSKYSLLSLESYVLLILWLFRCLIFLCLLWHSANSITAEAS